MAINLHKLGCLIRLAFVAFQKGDEEEGKRGLRDSFGQVGCLITFFLLIIRYLYCKW